MAKLYAASSLITMLMALTLTFAYPSMTSSGRYPASSATPAVNLNLNRRTISLAKLHLYELEFTTANQLNATLSTVQSDLDSVDLMILLSAVESHSQPEIPNSFITEAENCQNLQNVLDTTDKVLAEYITLVKAIPDHCFNFNIIAVPLRSLKVKVQRILGTTSQRVSTQDQNIITRDTQYTLQTMVSLKAQTDKMISIFNALQKCIQ